MNEKTSDKLNLLRFKKAIAISKRQRINNYIRRTNMAIAKEKHRIEKNDG